MTVANPKKVDKHLVSLTEPASIDAEHYRKLRYSIESSKEPDKGLVVAVTSSIAGDGKTLTSINLAGALSQNKHSKVLLIELDLRQPETNVRDYLGLTDKPHPGVVDKALDQSIQWQKCTRHLENFNLYVMLSGRLSDSPYEVLKSDGIGALLQEARKLFDYVIVDTPPLGILPDSQLISDWVDGYLLVVSADHTPRKALEETLNQMTPEKTLGIVFNQYSAINHRYLAKY